jgi:hypothetical protein
MSSATIFCGAACAEIDPRRTFPSFGREDERETRRRRCRSRLGFPDAERERARDRRTTTRIAATRESVRSAARVASLWVRRTTAKRDPRRSANYGGGSTALRAAPRREHRHDPPTASSRGDRLDGA